MLVTLVWAGYCSEDVPQAWMCNCRETGPSKAVFSINACEACGVEGASHKPNSSIVDGAELDILDFKAEL
jgi:hypothetical protein